MAQREVVHINAGVDEEGQIFLQFQHQDATTYTTKFSRAICARMITLLEQCHGQAMAQTAAVPQSRIGIHDTAQMRLTGDSDAGNDSTESDED